MVYSEYEKDKIYNIIERICDVNIDNNASKKIIQVAALTNDYCLELIYPDIDMLYNLNHQQWNKIINLCNNEKILYGFHNYICCLSELLNTIKKLKIYKNNQIFLQKEIRIFFVQYNLMKNMRDVLIYLLKQKLETILLISIINDLEKHFIKTNILTEYENFLQNKKIINN